MADPVSAQRLTVEEYCEKFWAWMQLVTNNTRFNDDAPAFQRTRLAITKSCLLDRTLYLGEGISQTPCPVHKGQWSGISINVGAVWRDMQGNETPAQPDANQIDEYERGCRCFQHKCGCTTGWQPDENCGCAS